MQHPDCAECDGTGIVQNIDVIWAPCEDDECFCDGHRVPDIAFLRCANCALKNRAAYSEGRHGC